LFTGAIVVEAGALLALGLTSSAWLAWATMVAVGLVSSVWDVAQVSLRQAIIPDRLMGRVVSAFRLVGFGAIPLGAVLGGMLGWMFGLRAPFLFGAATLVVMALLVPPVLNTRSVAAARAQADTARRTRTA
jgi:MFS family permease